MELGSTIIGAIFIALCIVPVIFMSQRRNKRKKQMLQSILKSASHQNCNISRYEFCGDFGIGMDELKNFVFFYRQTKDKSTEKTVDLSMIQNCKLINAGRTLKSKNGNQTVIDRLDLLFIPVIRQKPEILLELYNSDDSTELTGELQFGEKWSKLINDKLLNK